MFAMNYNKFIIVDYNLQVRVHFFWIRCLNIIVVWKACKAWEACARNIRVNALMIFLLDQDRDGKKYNQEFGNYAYKRIRHPC